MTGMSTTTTAALRRAIPTAVAYHAASFGGSGRPCDVAAEIRRSIELEAWLDGLDAATVLTSRRPRRNPSLVSVVLPMFNASRWIDTTLKSLLLQGDNLEVFCVDDASTDGSYEQVVRGFGADARVCVVRLEKNVGPYQIRNWVAARLARGTWLAFQDADDLSHPNRFAVQQRELRRRRALACGACAHQVFPGDIVPKRNDTKARQHGGMFHGFVFYSDVPRAVRSEPVTDWLLARKDSISVQDGKGTFRVPVSDSPALYPSLMIRRDAFLRLGGFDGRIAFAADRTFTLRLARFHEIVNVPAVLYTRHIHSRSLTQRPDTGYQCDARRDHFLAFDDTDRAVCQAIEMGDWQRARKLCTSDLYHADIAVAESSGPLPDQANGPPGTAN